MFNWRDIKNNIWNPIYYRTLLMEPFSASLKYYFKLILWLALVYTVFISLIFIPNLIKVSRQAIADFSAAYPSELRINLQNGTASVNQPEPVVVPLPETQKRIFAVNDGDGSTTVPLANLLVIDTRLTLKEASFDSYRSLFVLNKDGMIGSTGKETRTTKIPTDSSYIIDKDFVSTVASRVQSSIIFLAPLLVPIVYFLILLLLMIVLVPLAVVGLAAWALLLSARIESVPRPRLLQAFSVTLHASTLALVVNFFVFVLYPSLALNFPFLLTATLLVIYLNLIRRPPLSPVVPVSPTEIPADTVSHPQETEATSSSEEKETKTDSSATDK